MKATLYDPKRLLKRHFICFSFKNGDNTCKISDQYEYYHLFYVILKFVHKRGQKAYISVQVRIECDLPPLASQSL